MLAVQQTAADSSAVVRCDGATARMTKSAAGVEPMSQTMAEAELAGTNLAS